jgi:hypothetical protein
MTTVKQKEEIEQQQKDRQRPLNEIEDVIEGLENAILDNISNIEEYERIIKKED